MEKKPTPIIVSGPTMAAMTAAIAAAVGANKIACVTGTMAHTPSYPEDDGIYKLGECYYKEVEMPFVPKDKTPPGMGPSHAHIVSKQRKNKRKGWK